MLTRTLHPLVGYRLSFVIKDNLSKYYKAFRTCNDKHNRGDLTPFVIMFLEVVREACEQLQEELLQRQDDLNRFLEIVPMLSDDEKDA